MPTIHVNVSLYGSIARFGNGRHVAQVEVEFEPGARLCDLLARLGIPEAERGYLFINAVLCEVPGLSTGSSQLLCNGDHIGIFSVDRLWPYQYRDGIPMSESLKKLLAAREAMHHSYHPQVEEPPSEDSPDSPSSSR
jgi:hypothetical protein